VDDLSLHGDVLDTFEDMFHWLLNHNSFFNFPSDVLHLSFNSVVISDSSFKGNLFSPCDFLILNDLSLIGHLVDPLHLIIFHVFLLKGDVLDPALHGDVCCSRSLSGGTNVCASIIGSSVGPCGVGGRLGGRVGDRLGGRVSGGSGVDLVARVGVNLVGVGVAVIGSSRNIIGCRRGGIPDRDGGT